MSAFVNVKALVLRSVAYKESSRILTVLTDTEGKLTVSAPGAMRKNSRNMAAVQPLAFSEMTLSKNRDRYTLKESHVIEQFEELSLNLARFALGTYFAELIEAAADEDTPNPEILSLALNALYILTSDKPEELVKAATELRLMCLSGYAPMLDVCDSCGNEPRMSADRHNGAFLDLLGGTIYCRDCGSESDSLVPLGADALRAARYIASCDAKRLYAFTLAPDAMRELSRVTQAYTLAQSDRRFGALDYYHSIRRL